MAIALLISEDDVKQTSVIDENTDIKLIQSAIELAQDRHILPLLGSGIFNEIQTQINAGNVSSVNQTLLETYVQKALKWYTLYEGIDFLTYKFTNKTVSKKNSDNSQPIDIDELRRLMDKFLKSAEMYSERTTKFLIENQTSYPLFYNPGSGADIITPKKSSYTTSIYLGGSDDYSRLPKDKYDMGDNYCC